MSGLIWLITEPDLPLITFTIAILTVIVVVRRLRRT